MTRSARLFAGLISAALGLALAGCGTSPGLPVQPSAAQLQIIRGVPASYVYYPDYELYYSPNYGEYVFRFNYAWVTRTFPPDLPAGALKDARSVPMDFHDDPSLHHAEIAKKFPKNAAPASLPAAQMP